VLAELIVKGIPNFPAALADASSPSGWKRLWAPMGLIISGAEYVFPNMLTYTNTFSKKIMENFQVEAYTQIAYTGINEHARHNTELLVCTTICTICLTRTGVSITVHEIF
jgi:hypothetical protein